MLFTDKYFHGREESANTILTMVCGRLWFFTTISRSAKFGRFSSASALIRSARSAGFGSSKKYGGGRIFLYASLEVIILNPQDIASKIALSSDPVPEVFKNISCSRKISGNSAYGRGP